MGRNSDFVPSWFTELNQKQEDQWAEQEFWESDLGKSLVALTRPKDNPQSSINITDKYLEQAMWTPYSGLILDATPEMLNTNATAKAKKYLMRVERPVVESGWVESKEVGAEGRIKKFVFMIPAVFSAENLVGESVPRTAYLLGQINRHCEEVFSFLGDIAKTWNTNLSNTIRINGKFFDMNIIFRTRDTIHALRNPEVRSMITSVEPKDWAVDFDQGSIVLEAQFSEGYLFFKPLGFIDHVVNW
jgi:hypothetical protein